MNNIPTVTKNLLIINVLMYLATVVAEQRGINLSAYLGLHLVTSENFNLAQLVTYMFMHGGFQHLFFNMFAVWMFGRILEQVWDPKKFLTYYLVCGVGAGVIQQVVTGIHCYFALQDVPADLMQLLQTEGAEIMRQGKNYVDATLGGYNAMLNGPTVGASGAVYAILLGFGMIFPNQEMFVFPLPMPIKAKYFVMGYAAIELWSGLANNPADNVAHFAHLGGMIFGLLLILYWRKKNRQNGYYTY